MVKQKNMFEELKFYTGKKVLITGHSGFKGSWMSVLLSCLGAETYGVSLPLDEKENLFSVGEVGRTIKSFWGDVRDFSFMKRVFDDVQPEIVFHLAAQPIVLESYKKPMETYATNVMGTVNVCECIRTTEGVRSFVNVTTDKVYKNKEWVWGYREVDRLGGFDPYSNSKACSELVTDSYNNAFFKNREIAVSTLRAGNVIGGGDFADDRIIPDCFRAARNRTCIDIRNPHSIRPYQHVLEPLFAYLVVAKRQYEDICYAGNYNIGPKEEDCITTGELAEMFCQAWGNGLTWCNIHNEGLHESEILKLDCSKITKIFQWQPKWSIRQAVERCAEWYQKYLNMDNMSDVMCQQIKQYMTE